jgi:hypothetical protein
LLGEDLMDTAGKIVPLAPDDSDSSVSPLFTVLSCVLLGKDYASFKPWLEKMESQKNNLELLGTYQAIQFLSNRDEDNLVPALNDVLLAHHKEANSKRTHTYNTPGAFLSISPFLIIKVAEHLGMDIREKMTENKQTLKLGLSSPADFPDLPKNLLMTVEVDYLTARTIGACSSARIHPRYWCK